MSTLPDALSDLPDDALVPVGWIREQLEDGELSVEPEVITTGQAAELWPAYSEDTWRRWASGDEIPGAWQDAESGPWRLPLASCRSVVAEKQRRGQRRGQTGPKGPWAGRKAS